MAFVGVRQYRMVTNSSADRELPYDMIVALQGDDALSILLREVVQDGPPSRLIVRVLYPQII